MQSSSPLEMFTYEQYTYKRACFLKMLITLYHIENFIFMWGKFLIVLLFFGWTCFHIFSKYFSFCCSSFVNFLCSFSYWNGQMFLYEVTRLYLIFVNTLSIICYKCFSVHLAFTFVYRDIDIIHNIYAHTINL